MEHLKNLVILNLAKLLNKNKLDIWFRNSGYHPVIRMLQVVCRLLVVVCSMSGWRKCIEHVSLFLDETTVSIMLDEVESVLHFIDVYCGEDVSFF